MSLCAVMKAKRRLGCDRRISAFVLSAETLSARKGEYRDEKRRNAKIGDELLEVRVSNIEGRSKWGARMHHALTSIPDIHLRLTILGSYFIGRRVDLFKRRFSC
jgi:hypothetical protein